MCQGNQSSDCFQNCDAPIQHTLCYFLRPPVVGFRCQSVDKRSLHEAKYMLPKGGRMIGEKSRLRSSSDQFRTLRCERNRKKSKFECNRLFSSIEGDVVCRCGLDRSPFGYEYDLACHASFAEQLLRFSSL